MQTSTNESGQSLLDVNGAGQFLNMTPARIRYEVWMGRIPHLKIGKSIRFRLSDLKQWLDSKIRGI